MKPIHGLAALLVLLVGAGLVVLFADFGSPPARALEGPRPNGRTPGEDGPQVNATTVEELLPPERLPLHEESALRESSARIEEPLPDPSEEPRRPPTPEELADFYAFADDAVAEVRSQKTKDELRVVEARRAKLEDHLREYSQVLGLADHQSEALREVMQRELDREVEYVLLRENGASEKEVEHLRKADRESRLVELAGFLNEKQLNGLDLRRRGRQR